jgi:hypothetical protein
MHRWVTWILSGSLMFLPFAAKAQPAKAKPGSHLLLLLPAPPDPSGAATVDPAELGRVSGLFLSPYRVRIELGPPLGGGGFLDQIRKAKSLGTQRKAIAVVWYRVIRQAGGSAELYLHLVDLITDKALIRTLKLRGRVGPDLHRAAALKLWSLLRASLLELGAARRARNPNLDRMARLPAGPRPPAKARPRPAAPAGPALKRRVVRRAWVGLSVGYQVGIFATGKAFHHGADLSLDVTVKHFNKLNLALTLGLGAELIQPVSLDVGAASLRLDLIPLAVRFLVRWNSRQFTLQSGLRAGVLALRAESFISDGQTRKLWRADPFVGADFRIGWRPLARFSLYWQIRAEGLIVGQCFVEGSAGKTCADRARFTSGLGVELTLP